MRKILLTTAALFAVANGAHAATSPVNVTLGGSTDFVAANFADQNHGSNLVSNHRDFETIYGLNVTVAGKTATGLEYGSVIGLTNANDISNLFGALSQNSPYLNAGNIYLASSFGKVVLGDSHGATDLTVGAPSVGEGQATGRYVDFLDTVTFAKTFVYGVDGTDHSTNVTYFTPKVGYEGVKAQLAASYIPQFYNTGTGSVKYNNGLGGATNNFNALSGYHDVYKIAGNVSGTVSQVALTGSAHVIGGSSNQNGANNDGWTTLAPSGRLEGFAAWGVGLQAALDGFTLGGSYTDNGRYNTVLGQNKNQNQYSAGLKYEFSKIGLAANYTGGEGYDNMLQYTAANTGSTTPIASNNYIKTFDSYGVGATYSWAPGLTSNVDGVIFNQTSQDNVKNDGYVLLVSQKLAF